jgi:hypothetical protein
MIGSIFPGGREKPPDDNEGGDSPGAGFSNRRRAKLESAPKVFSIVIKTFLSRDKKVK